MGRCKRLEIRPICLHLFSEDQPVPRMTKQKTKQVAEFGDFQTPGSLAQQVCAVLFRRQCKPNSLIEPTCGAGSFLVAALDRFPGVAKAIGLDISPRYVKLATSQIRSHGHADKVEVRQRDFFRVDWARLFADLPEPILVIGNPPWVTNSELGTLGSRNLPEKSNFQKHNGLDAMTGKSNFDISEWMLIRLIEKLANHRATMAMLCKTAVARKVLLHAWKNRLPLRRSEIRLIDASKYFGAAVDACLLMCTFEAASENDHGSGQSAVYHGLDDKEPSEAIGCREGRLVANVDSYERWHHLEGAGAYRWRSGIKHDCSKVMEFHKEGNRYRNGLGELIELEDAYLYPMLKSSDLANGSTKKPTRWMLVTQRQVAEETKSIETNAPKTWHYLLCHADRLDKRASSIYHKRPRFSVFGVGDYSFAPWKVAISAFYKRLEFAEVGQFSKKPIVLDDTAYSLACQTRQEARAIAELLNSKISREFFSAFIFWDAKRPITIDVLQRLNINALARELGVGRGLLRSSDHQERLFG